MGIRKQVQQDLLEAIFIAHELLVSALEPIQLYLDLQLQSLRLLHEDVFDLIDSSLNGERCQVLEENRASFHDESVVDYSLGLEDAEFRRIKDTLLGLFVHSIVVL